MGWESETQDAQHLKTVKALDKKWDGSFIYPWYRKAQEYRSCMAEDICHLYSFFPCCRACAINPLISVLINSWYQIVKSLWKGVNVMLVGQSWDQSPGTDLIPTAGSSKEQILS